MQLWSGRDLICELLPRVAVSDTGCARIPQISWGIAHIFTEFLETYISFVGSSMEIYRNLMEIRTWRDTGFWHNLQLATSSDIAHNYNRHF